MSANKIIIAVYPAVGGPTTVGIGSDGNQEGPTDQGDYVIAYCGKHSSPKMYQFWSKITWGTQLRERKGVLEVYVSGRWQALKNFTPATADDIKKYHLQLYGTYKIPDKWVFNDFGHETCYFFKDLNKNRKKDRGEPIHPEFMHTTPGDEANTVRGRPVILTESHGCIHVKPKDIDDMKQKGYLNTGNSFIVHGYSNFLPLWEMGAGQGPFEVHFYPGAQMIAVKGVGQTYLEMVNSVAF